MARGLQCPAGLRDDMEPFARFQGAHREEARRTVMLHDAPPRNPARRQADPDRDAGHDHTEQVAGTSQRALGVGDDAPKSARTQRPRHDGPEVAPGAERQGVRELPGDEVVQRHREGSRPNRRRSVAAGMKQVHPIPAERKR